MAATNAAITANFPCTVLTELGTTNTDPTFENLQVMQVQLNANAASIHSDCGDVSVNGHLTLMITPTDYALRSINHVTFTPPTNPQAVHAHAVDATAAQIAEDNRAHVHQRQEFNHCHNVDKTLRTQLIAAVPVIYITDIRDPVIRFGNTTPLELLAHLHHTYGGITEAELDRNTYITKAQCQPPTAIEVPFLQIEDRVDFTLAGDDPKSEPTTLRNINHVTFTPPTNPPAVPAHAANA
jgi:hypothetical protein